MKKTVLALIVSMVSVVDALSCDLLCQIQYVEEYPTDSKYDSAEMELALNGEAQKRAENGEMFFKILMAKAFSDGEYGIQINNEKSIQYANEIINSKNDELIFKDNENMLTVINILKGDAEFILGNYFYRKKDYKKAIKHFKNGHVLGSSIATFNLATMHKKGYGVLQDFNAAFSLYLDAAKAGTPEAIHQMAYMILHGEGRDESVEEAYAYYNVAASKGVNISVKARDELLSQMTSEQITEGQKLSRKVLSLINSR